MAYAVYYGMESRDYILCFAVITESIICGREDVYYAVDYGKSGEMLWRKNCPLVV